jgi:tRNA nucleotidyltransferase (CCA-adding enzyme)
VDLGDLVQVVARSITDDIDAGAVARQLGGGGHARAAAASVHGSSIRAVRDQIVHYIAANSQSAVTVRHIMSSGRPQTLSPDMAMEDAYTLMRRYGHEGFPVVERQNDGSETLLGVLTRREADRAMNHKLGRQPVRRFMQAGQVSVQPGDSIAVLRKVMIGHGWGQVPVVDETGRIIGIVTRTDLIKLWDESEPPARHTEEIDRRLRTALPAAQLALLRHIGQEVDRMNDSAYVVGGFVRDLLLDGTEVAPRGGNRLSATAQHPNGVGGRVSAFDMDIVIEGDAIAFAQGMKARYGGRVVTHKRFGTAKWLLENGARPEALVKLLADLALPPATAAAQSIGDIPHHLDFITARTEFYTAPTVLPTVELSNIKLDLHRRDFTINTLAFCLNPDRWGELFDFYGGLNDLRSGLVRVLHSLSFVDDPTRILRAVRYEQRFAFQIEPRTLELLGEAIELLDRVTPARIRHEIERILQEAEPERALQRLQELGVMARIHPALRVDQWIIQQFARLRAALARADASTYLAHSPVERLYWGLLTMRLPAMAQAEIQARLMLRSETVQLMAALRTLHTQADGLRDPHLQPSQAAAILDPIDLVAQALYLTTDLDPQVANVMQKYAEQWRHIRPLLNGADLQELGLPRGPLYGEILQTLRAACMDGTIKDREEEITLALALAGAPSGVPSGPGW